jgi:DNA oxidative demethylase
VLFATPPIELEPDFWLLPKFSKQLKLTDIIATILLQAPLRHLIIPGGKQMTVAMSNCGNLGWTSDSRGYRYTVIDPLTGHAWPSMPG